MEDGKVSVTRGGAIEVHMGEGASMKRDVKATALMCDLHNMSGWRAPE